jgi:mannose-6-phosphate isomerase-like protein (cupin superfamily)
MVKEVHMKRFVAIVWSGTLVLAYMAGSAVGPAGSAAQTAAGAQQPAPAAGALPPGEYSKIQLAPDQGQPTHYSGEALRKAHVALQARAKSGQAGGAPRDLMTPLVTRNYSYILLHRANAARANQKPAAELHDGVTDIYYVVGGSGTVHVGGEIENRRISRPGEYGGQMAAGKPFKLQAGDILTIPPNTAHGTVPDPGGMTYVLQKINVGLYPWSLINGTP